MPYLKLYDGGHWHKGSEAVGGDHCRLIGVIEPDASSGHMFAAVTVDLQDVCQHTEPDVVLTYVRPHEATTGGHEMRCGPDALGPHDGGVIDWVCVACEEDWYELLCVALECKDVLDQGDIPTTSGQKAKVEVMHVAVWRWYENVWDVSTDAQDVVKDPMDFRSRPKDPDAALNFGYTNVPSAAATGPNAVTGAIVGVLTPTQGQRLLATFPGAWTLTVNEDLYICVQTSQQSIRDVKACRWGHQDDSEAAAGGSAGLRAAKGIDKDEMRRGLLSLTYPTWTRMDPGAKSQFWMFVGLTADGKNVEVSREDSVLKEGPPMVGNCSYGEACQVRAPQALWPYVCAQPGCKAYVDLMCCEQYVDGLKDDVRDSNDVQDLVKPSNSRKNVVCWGCLNRAIKGLNREKKRASSSSPQKKKLQKTASRGGGGRSGVFVSHHLCTV